MSDREYHQQKRTLKVSVRNTDAAANHPADPQEIKEYQELILALSDELNAHREVLNRLYHQEFRGPLCRIKGLALVIRTCIKDEDLKQLDQFAELIQVVVDNFTKRVDEIIEKSPYQAEPDEQLYNTLELIRQVYQESQYPRPSTDDTPTGDPTP
ncbi:hypothetical protein SAMN05421823_102536 [Catalinimonas alkaloidigena]|uniref:Uncharacterized protein n=1 Tax=Catalinimonas alkaloidigena TaxID=1075417 RepID=A0A1G9B776_9BACT|nr:HAMP domain-containing histidine kinase [Catalinimonas alkaloidigena]SDK35406.1 hypothetical protein SAMN05421823_102536 [Catalinimonas alkaloidigena]